MDKTEILGDSKTTGLVKGSGLFFELIRWLMNIAGRCGILGIIVVLTAGCSTPAFITKHRSSEVPSEPIKELNLILVKGDFPMSAMNRVGRGFEKPSWYQDVGERIEQNFNHNGIRISAARDDRQYVVEGTPTLYKTTPTLVLQTKLLQINSKNGADMGSLLFEAQLWVPGRNKPVWKGEAGVWIHQAADELSIRLLNELARLGLLAPTHTPAETLSGKKHTTFGGVLAP